jgi:SAM-dependent methyltransferase
MLDTRVRAAKHAPRVYPLGHSPQELDRLTIQAQRLAEDSVTLLRRAGITNDQRVLDIGCGPGDLTFHAADLVGPKGRVVGVDASAAAIDAARTRAASLGYENVEFITCDLDEEPALHGFDAIVGRLVLMYVGDPIALLRRLRTGLRPGGLVVLQEPDGATAGSTPDCPLFLRMKSWIIAAFETSGSRINLGSSLGGMLRRAGYSVEGSYVWQPALVGATLANIDWFVDLVRTLMPIIESRGIATAEDIDIDTLGARLFAEATTLDAMLFKPRFIGVWARNDTGAGVAPGRRA